jgi:extracellular factor (EF) 3-hydroxypalmitic acid methyl ester biosynthesis protein
MTRLRTAAPAISTAAAPVRRGRVEDAGGATRDVTLAPGTRISLHVTFTDGGPVADRTVFPRLVVETGTGELALTTCRFHAESGAPARAGRLVFLDEVLDCNALVFEGRRSDLKAGFENLPLVLSQRERIRPEFRDWVADTLFDISVYQRFFDDQDRLLAGEPPDAVEAARDALIRTHGRRFIGFLEDRARALADVVAPYSKEEHERHGFYLRRQAWHLILASAIHRRTNLKPRGYAGDSEMMRLIYEDAYAGRTTFEKLLHKQAVEMPAAQAVRNRRRLIPQVLREVLDRFPDLPVHGFRFLSVASGPAWEMQDLFLDAADVERFHCVLLDQDTEALETAQEGIARIEAARGIRARVEYVNESVRTMLRSRDLAERLGTHHFIYSMGLFDYLTPPVARAVLARVFELLEPGGTLLVGNYHVGNPTRVYMDYWMDWPLYYRTEESFLELADGVDAATREVTFDETGCQMFLRLDRAR